MQLMAPVFRQESYFFVGIKARIKISGGINGRQPENIKLHHLGVLCDSFLYITLLWGIIYQSINSIHYR